MRHPCILPCALLLLLALPATATQVYQWRDAQGNLQISDKPPPAGVQASTRTLEEGPAAPDPELQQYRERTRALHQALDAQRASDATAARKQTTAEAEAARECTHARRTLAKYREANSLYDRDENGELRWLDDSTKQREEARLQAWIRANCR